MLEASRKNPFYSNGLYFSCTCCSACCRFESGYVFLSKKDVSILRDNLHMEYKEFIETYCRWIPMENKRYELSLKEKSNFDCIFWKNGVCSVYGSRPLQCKAFPFWSSIVNSKKNWEATGKDCPGIGRQILHSPDSINRWLAQREKEPIMSRGVL